jgi:hypothetical protein
MALCNRDEDQLTATAIESQILAATSAMAGKSQQVEESSQIPIEWG